MDRVLIQFRRTLNELIDEKGLTTKELSHELQISYFVLLKWKNHYRNPRLGSLLKLADYFNCSIEFLCGKTTEFLNYVPNRICPKFGDRIDSILKQCNNTAYQLFKNTSIKNSQYHYWKKGSEPVLTSLEAIAEYLGITIDYLVGRDS